MRTKLNKQPANYFLTYRLLQDGGIIKSEIDLNTGILKNKQNIIKHQMKTTVTDLKMYDMDAQTGQYHTI